MTSRLAREETPISTPAEGAPKGVFLQLGAFANQDNAENLKNHLGRARPA